MKDEKQEGMPSKFRDFEIDPSLISVLERNKFITPTPIQSKVIPIALNGGDVIGIAQTGTGKTLAFGIPIVQKIIKGNCQALIVLPTRELALQVEEMLQKICRQFNINTAVLIGGASMRTQLGQLNRRPQIIISTPGRLCDHLKQKTYSLKNIKIIVLDEADRMFDVGFAPQIKKILDDAPENIQTLLFSATMPDEIAKMSVNYMRTPLRIEVAPQGTSAENVEQEMYLIKKEARSQLLEDILTKSSIQDKVLIFVRTKYGAKRLAGEIKAMGFTASDIHSNKSLAQRKEALAGFKSGKYKVLVATDIASRGIDVHNIAAVINYDLPDDVTDYVHRIGRTGRAESSGKAITFVSQNEKFVITKIERLIKKQIKLKNTPILPEKRASIVPTGERFYGHRSSEPRSRSSEPRSRNQESRAREIEPRTRDTRDVRSNDDFGSNNGHNYDRVSRDFRRSESSEHRSPRRSNRSGSGRSSGFSNGRRTIRRSPRKNRGQIGSAFKK